MIFLLFIYLVGLEFELRASYCKAGSLLLEPHTSSPFFSGYFGDGSHELFTLADFEP
jgi:hypothetical protein